MPLRNRIPATVVRTTPASVEAVWDCDGVTGGLTGVDITLWFCDTAGDEPVPFEVGDTVELVLSKPKAGSKPMLRLVHRNIAPSQNESAVG